MRLSALYLSISLFFAPQLMAAGLTKVDIQKVVNSNHDQVKACYDLYTKLEDQTPRRIRMEIKVSKDGRVNNVKVAEDNFPNKDVATCLSSKVHTWVFPAPLPNQPSTFSYPFNFGNSPDAGPEEPEIDAQTYRGRVFKRSNRPITEISVFQNLAKNKAIKAKGHRCDDLDVLAERCEKLQPKDRVVCSALTDTAPKKPFTPDWILIDHPDAFRIESNVYFMGYWHISCEEIKKLKS